MPMIVLLSVEKNSFGAYEASVATTTLPADVSFDGTIEARDESLLAVGIAEEPDEPLVVPVVDVLFPLLLQAAAATIRQTAMAAITALGVGRDKLMWSLRSLVRSDRS
jgi:hypothetical protein